MRAEVVSSPPQLRQRKNNGYGGSKLDFNGDKSSLHEREQETKRLTSFLWKNLPLNVSLQPEQWPLPQGPPHPVGDMQMFGRLSG